MGLSVLFPMRWTPMQRLFLKINHGEVWQPAHTTTWSRVLLMRHLFLKASQRPGRLTQRIASGLRKAVLNGRRTTLRRVEVYPSHFLKPCHTYIHAFAHP